MKKRRHKLEFPLNCPDGMERKVLKDKDGIKKQYCMKKEKTFNENKHYEALLIEPKSEKIVFALHNDYSHSLPDNYEDKIEYLLDESEGKYLVLGKWDYEQNFTAFYTLEKHKGVFYYKKCPDEFERIKLVDSNHPEYEYEKLCKMKGNDNLFFSPNIKKILIIKDWPVIDDKPNLIYYKDKEKKDGFVYAMEDSRFFANIFKEFSKFTTDERIKGSYQND